MLLSSVAIICLVCIKMVCLSCHANDANQLYVARASIRVHCEHMCVCYYYKCPLVRIHTCIGPYGGVQQHDICIIGQRSVLLTTIHFVGHSYFSYSLILSLSLALPPSLSLSLYCALYLSSSVLLSPIFYLCFCRYIRHANH